ncbi:MAG: hypothetical protein KDK99_19665 [Verrucomicrobiales bacterium]|nr:hypothetical protein [Verrucomicrobiales bacterium]
MNLMLAATRLPLSTLLIIGGAVAFVIIAWSYSHWRAAVKVAFVAVLLEGAIRKWILPQGQEMVYFLKDIFLVGAYLKFYLAPDPDIRAYRLKVPATILSICAVLVCFSALNPNINSGILSLYGIKIYFMYLPLTFMMPYLFRTEQEMTRQLTWYALLAIPICILGIIQWQSGKFSMMNTFAGDAGDEIITEHGATGFGFGDKARITGTFSYITGHATFVIFFSTLCLVLLSLKETRFKWAIIGVCLPLLAGNALMNGSRASLVTLAFVGFGMLLASTTGRIGSSKHFTVVLMTGALAAIMGIGYLFTEAWTYWETRFEFSGDNLKTRIIDHPYFAITNALEDGGGFGYGIGTAHPATDAIRKKLNLGSPDEAVPVYDNELGQVLVELGIVGFCAWYLMRFVLVLLAWNSFLQSPPGPVRAMSLVGVLITGPFLLMSVVYNHTANFFIFALAGFALIPLLEPTVQRRHAAAGNRPSNSQPVTKVRGSRTTYLGGRRSSKPIPPTHR